MHNVRILLLFCNVRANEIWIDFFFFLISLTKNYRDRPKYAELLETDFLKQYDHANIDVAAWFASVMEMHVPKNTEPRR